VIARGLNVRQTEALVRAERQTIKANAARPRDANTLAVERDLSGRLGLPVRLQPRGSGGTLTIAYRSLEQLDALIRRLT
jgi:ParB family chromosome partitioning protein